MFQMFSDVQMFQIMHNNERIYNKRYGDNLNIIQNFSEDKFGISE